MVSEIPPVVPNDVALRVDKCPVTVSRVDKRGWPGVRSKKEFEVRSPACDCLVSQGGSVADGAEVSESAEVPKTPESAVSKFVLL